MTGRTAIESSSASCTLCSKSQERKRGRVVVQPVMQLYGMEYFRLQLATAAVLSPGTSLQRLAWQLPPNFNDWDVPDLLDDLETGGIILPRPCLTLREAVFILGDEELPKQVFEGVLAKCPNLDHPRDLGKRET
jgi:hypothetical protein